MPACSGKGASTLKTDGGSASDAGDASNAGDAGLNPDSGRGDAGRVDSGGPLSACDDKPPSSPPHPANLELQSEWANARDFAVHTAGIWAIWWDPQFDHTDDARWLVAELDDVRCRSLLELGMRDPPNPGAGYYYNVYIHHGAADSFPDGWANGQGTDSFGQPFLTLPDGAHLDPGNIAHEGFHVFQYSANSPGFAYSGDTQWYVESAAQWYAAYRRPKDVETFIEAGAIDGNPHLALWHSFSNEAPGDPTDWLFQVRQYGMHTWLYYLTEVARLPRDIITAGFYGAEERSPQHYHYERAGRAVLRAAFADWAASNTADFDYLTREQVARARAEVQNVADLDNLHPYVATHDSTGTAGVAVKAPAALLPRGWAYNVVRIRNDSSATFDFELTADPAGSMGAASHFEGRVVVQGRTKVTYVPLTMSSATQGSASVVVTAEDALVYLIVVSAPEHFAGNQTYGYAYQIRRR